MPEKILRMVVNSEKYDDPDQPYILHKELRFSNIQKERLRAIAYNENCPSDLLDILSKIEDPAVLERVIYNKNTNIETLKNMYKDGLRSDIKQALLYVLNRRMQ